MTAVNNANTDAWSLLEQKVAGRLELWTQLEDWVREAQALLRSTAMPPLDTPMDTIFYDLWPDHPEKTTGPIMLWFAVRYAVDDMADWSQYVSFPEEAGHHIEQIKRWMGRLDYVRDPSPEEIAARIEEDEINGR